MTLYERYNTGDTTGTGIYSTDWEAQTFTIGNTGPNEDHNITSVKLLLSRTGNPGTVIVSIRDTDGDGKPTGDDLTSGTTNGNTLPVHPNKEWREITLTPYPLSASTKYAIVVRAPDGNYNNDIAWRIDDDDPTYEGGSEAYSSNSGDTWVLDESLDFIFEEYGIANGGPETHTPSDTAKTSDSIAFKIFHKIFDTAKAQNIFFPNKFTLTDVAKTSDSVTYSFIKGIETPTDDVQIFRNDLSL